MKWLQNANKKLLRIARMSNFLTQSGQCSWHQLGQLWLQGKGALLECCSFIQVWKMKEGRKMKEGMLRCAPRSILQWRRDVDGETWNQTHDHLSISRHMLNWLAARTILILSKVQVLWNWYVDYVDMTNSGIFPFHKQILQSQESDHLCLSCCVWLPHEWSTQHRT